MGILPADQLIIIEGDEWIMEDCKVITEVWSPEDLAAVCKKGPNWTVKTDLN